MDMTKVWTAAHGWVYLHAIVDCCTRQARKEITAYIDTYHHRPHSGLGYRTPNEVRRTWEDHHRLQKTAA